MVLERESRPGFSGNAPRLGWRPYWAAWRNKRHLDGGSENRHLDAGSQRQAFSHSVLEGQRSLAQDKRSAVLGTPAMSAQPRRGEGKWLRCGSNEPRLSWAIARVRARFSDSCGGSSGLQAAQKAHELRGGFSRGPVSRLKQKFSRRHFSPRPFTRCRIAFRSKARGQGQRERMGGRRTDWYGVFDTTRMSW